MRGPQRGIPEGLFEPWSGLGKMEEGLGRSGASAP